MKRALKIIALGWVLAVLLLLGTTGISLLIVQAAQHTPGHLPPELRAPALFYLGLVGTNLLLIASVVYSRRALLAGPQRRDDRLVLFLLWAVGFTLANGLAIGCGIHVAVTGLGYPYNLWML